MSLIISLGTNIGDRILNLQNAREEIGKYFHIISCSKVYASDPVDYLDQPAFLNQVIELKTPIECPESIMKTLLEIEARLGRIRDIPKGPRIIDIDILFLDQRKISSHDVNIPHPRVFDRPFCIIPLRDLECFEELNSYYHFPPYKVESSCYPVDINI